MNFNLKSTAIYESLHWEGFYGLIRFFKTTLIFVFILAFITKSLSLSAAATLASFMFLLWQQEMFFRHRMKYPALKYSISEMLSKPEEFNMASALNFDVAKSFRNAIGFSKSKKMPQVASQALLYFIIDTKNPAVNFIFSRALLGLKAVKKELKEYLNNLPGQEFSNMLSQDLENSIKDAASAALQNNHSRIEMGDMIAGLAKNDPFFRDILIKASLKPEDILNISQWADSIWKNMKERKKFWEYKNLIRMGSVAKDWSSGYTVTLDQLSTDWTEVIKNRGYSEIAGHEKELAELERVLSRDQINNALLVGEPGSGKLSMIHSLAMKSLFNLSTPQVNSKRVVSLDIPSLLARVSSRTEVEAILDRAFREAIMAGNVILVIDDLHNYIGQEERPGIIDITGVISPYLHLSNFQIIGITNFVGLHKFIEPNQAILNLFEKVEVGEISEAETIKLLEDKAFYFEGKYKKFIPYAVLRDIVKYCTRYIQNIPFPKKATDLLDEIVVYASRYVKSPVIMPDIVARVVSDKTQIPVGDVEKEEKEILLNLEDLIHQRIINQEEAVNEISSALRRARADITVRKGPMGTFLFLGPTGVGKTETAKALAEIYYGGENKMIRLDMSEFQSISDIGRLIGSAEEDGILTTQVRENPFSMILLDEIEKAHKNVLNLFLQVFDEGSVTDGLGRKVSFTNTIIIATSNAGYQVILDALKNNKLMQDIKAELFDYLFKEAIFRPEFLNRFDAAIIFKSLTKEHLLQIADLLLKKLQKNLKQKDINFIIGDSLKEKIAELGYDPIFGARQMRRVIQDKIENVLASSILSNKISAGDSITINPETFGLEVQK